MLSSVSYKNCINFGENEQEKTPVEKPYLKDTLLKNNISTNFKISADKFENSITTYPYRGFIGSKKSNFYEFLTTGMFPYLVGSLTLMGVFNYANKFFDNFGASKAGEIGKKMALGVLFYGIAKSASGVLVTKPVKWTTGVDVNLPYAKVVYSEPENKKDTDIRKTEYHKVFESVEFPRWDLLYSDEKSGKPRNAYYDRVAHKMGLGDNLTDSDQEVKPKIKAVVTKTTAATRIIQYLWAGVGVAYAMQDAWGDYLKGFKFNHHISEFKGEANKNKSFNEKFKLSFKNFKDVSISELRSLKWAVKRSAQQFYNPRNPKTFWSKYAGKALLFSAILATVFADVVACSVPKKAEKLQKKDNVIDKTRKYTVD